MHVVVACADLCVNTQLCPYAADTVRACSVTRGATRSSTQGQRAPRKQRQAAANPVVQHHVTFVPALSTSIGLPSPQRTASPRAGFDKPSGGSAAPDSAPTGSTSSGAGPRGPPRRRPPQRTPRGGAQNGEGAGPPSTGAPRPQSARRAQLDHTPSYAAQASGTVTTGTRTFGHSKHHFTAGSAPQVGWHIRDAVHKRCASLAVLCIVRHGVRCVPDDAHTHESEEPHPRTSQRVEHVD